MHLSNPPLRLAGIFITHMHGDHVYGLPSMLLHLNVANMQNSRARREAMRAAGESGSLSHRQAMIDSGFYQADYAFSEESPLHIYGPEGLYNYIVSSLRLTHAKLSLNVAVHELVMPRPDSHAGVLGRRYDRGHPAYRRAAGFKALARPVPQFAFDPVVTRHPIYQFPSTSYVPPKLSSSLSSRKTARSESTLNCDGAVGTRESSRWDARSPLLPREKADPSWEQVWELPMFIELDINMHSKAVPNPHFGTGMPSTGCDGDTRGIGYDRDVKVSKSVPFPAAAAAAAADYPSALVQDGRKTRALHVKAVRLDHTVPTVGFVIEESPLPGNIDVEKCVARGLLPGPAYQRLKSGEDVAGPDGNGVVRHRDVVGARRRGRKVVIMGDTRDSAFMVAHARDSDVVIHEATVHYRKGGSRKRHATSRGTKEDYASSALRAWKTGHSTPTSAGAFARTTRAKRLILTHFSARYDTGRFISEPMYVDFAAKDIDFATKDLVADAREAFGSDCVVAARDFMVLKIPRGGFS
jgi:ribonuclease BN (tRNA processing enzyme)